MKQDNRFIKAMAYLVRANEKVRLILTMSAFLVGGILLLIIMLAFGEDEYIALGRLFGKFVFYMFTLFMIIGCFTQDFGDLVRLGVKRGTALLAVTGETVGISFLIECAFILLTKFERFIIRIAYNDPKEILNINFTDGNLWYVGFGLLLLIFMLGLVAAVCIKKFGQNGLIAIYFIYIFLVVLLPQVIGKLVTSFPILGQIFSFLLANSVLALTGAVILFVIVCALLLRYIYRSAV